MQARSDKIRGALVEGKRKTSAFSPSPEERRQPGRHALSGCPLAHPPESFRSPWGKLTGRQRWSRGWACWLSWWAGRGELRSCTRPLRRSIPSGWSWSPRKAAPGQTIGSWTGSGWRRTCCWGWAGRTSYTRWSRWAGCPGRQKRWWRRWRWTRWRRRPPGPRPPPWGSSAPSCGRGRSWGSWSVQLSRGWAEHAGRLERQAPGTEERSSNHGMCTWQKGSGGPQGPSQLSSCKLYGGSRCSTINSPCDSLYPPEQCTPPV